MTTRFFVILFLAAPLAVAQETPTIKVTKGTQINIAVASLTGPNGAAATKILQNDLVASGAFAIVPEANATYVVKGTADAGGIGGNVTDRGGSVALSKSYRGDVRSAAHQFADDIVATLTGARGIAQSRIAFISQRSGAKEVYVCDYDGANMRQLTRDGSISVGPRLSGDGRRLAYTGYKSGYADVYVIELASGARNRVLKYPGTNTGAAFSPDGGRFAVTLSKDGNPDLYVTSSSGGGARRLTSTQGAESSPTWSPDGEEIIYSSDDGGSPQLYRISASGGRPQRLGAGYAYCTEPNWSPDGSKVAFNTRSGGQFQIAVYDLAGGNARVLPTGGDARSPQWGPDSRHIVFSQGGDIYLLDAQTGKKTKVVSGVGNASEPAWSR